MFGSAAPYSIYNDAQPFLRWARKQGLIVGVVSNAEYRYRDAILPTLGLHQVRYPLKTRLSFYLQCWKCSPTWWNGSWNFAVCFAGFRMGFWSILRHRRIREARPTNLRDCASESWWSGPWSSPSHWRQSPEGLPPGQKPWHACHAARQISNLRTSSCKGGWRAGVFWPFICSEVYRGIAGESRSSSYDLNTQTRHVSYYPKYVNTYSASERNPFGRKWSLGLTGRQQGYEQFRRCRRPSWAGSDAAGSAYLQTQAMYRLDVNELITSRWWHGLCRLEFLLGCVSHTALSSRMIWSSQDCVVLCIIRMGKGVPKRAPEKYLPDVLLLLGRRVYTHNRYFDFWFLKESILLVN